MKPLVAVNPVNARSTIRARGSCAAGGPGCSSRPRVSGWPGCSGSALLTIDSIETRCSRRTGGSRPTRCSRRTNAALSARCSRRTKAARSSDLPIEPILTWRSRVSLTTRCAGPAGGTRDPNACRARSSGWTRGSGRTRRTAWAYQTLSAVLTVAAILTGGTSGTSGSSRARCSRGPSITRRTRSAGGSCRTGRSRRASPRRTRGPGCSGRSCRTGWPRDSTAALRRYGDGRIANPLRAATQLEMPSNETRIADRAGGRPRVWNDEIGRYRWIVYEGYFGVRAKLEVYPYRDLPELLSRTDVEAQRLLWVDVRANRRHDIQDRKGHGLYRPRANWAVVL